MSRPISSESVFRALAHPTRRAIVMALRRGEYPAGEILSAKLASKPTISDHLRALQHAGVIGFRHKGTRLMYRLNARALKPVEHFLAEIQSEH